MLPHLWLETSGPRLTAVQCLEGMAAGLYEELFTAIVSLINRYFTVMIYEQARAKEYLGHLLSE